jgi:hypothetical protein
VISNARGIFLTFIRSRNEAYTAQQFRLLRSTDGDRFKVLYEATNATNPPVLETDEENNLFMVRPDFLDGHAYLYRFLASEDYARPRMSKIPNGSAGKYAMIYDRPRQQLYYFAHNNTFHIVGRDGQVRHSVTLLQAGPDAVLQYPLLSLMPGGTLHAAWTTQKHGKYLYWDIHHMLSPDGGRTWQTMKGRPIALPAMADQHGPTDQVIRKDEYQTHTWLSNFLAKDGKLHFLYQAQNVPPRQHYLRYDLPSGNRDVDIWPTFRGQRIALMGLDGFLTSRASFPGAPLYCVMANQGHIACLASDDNGQTWYDYASSRDTYSPYAIGGCRELTADGWIIGSFSDNRGSGQGSPPSRVFFIKIRGGLSRARVVAQKSEGGTTTLRFEEVRGQPEEIRLGHGEGTWGPWKPFQLEIVEKTETPPQQYQLKSRLGVISGPFALTNKRGK